VGVHERLQFARVFVQRLRDLGEVTELAPPRRDPYRGHMRERVAQECPELGLQRVCTRVRRLDRVERGLPAAERPSASDTSTEVYGPNVFALLVATAASWIVTTSEPAAAAVLAALPRYLPSVRAGPTGCGSMRQASRQSNSTTTMLTTSPDRARLGGSVSVPDWNVAGSIRGTERCSLCGSPRVGVV
jgi:hypothetical protein